MGPGDLSAEAARWQRKREQRKRKRSATLCKYDANGVCRDGDACAYLHQGPEGAPGQRRKEGAGADALARMYDFNSAAGVVERVVSGQTFQCGLAPAEGRKGRSATVCKYDARGWCRDGDACAYLHQEYVRYCQLSSRQGKRKKKTGGAGALQLLRPNVSCEEWHHHNPSTAGDLEVLDLRASIRRGMPGQACGDTSAVPSFGGDISERRRPRKGGKATEEVNVSLKEEAAVRSKEDADMSFLSSPSHSVCDGDDERCSSHDGSLKQNLDASYLTHLSCLYMTSQTENASLGRIGPSLAWQPAHRTAGVFACKPGQPGTFNGNPGSDCRCSVVLEGDSASLEDLFEEDKMCNILEGSSSAGSSGGGGGADYPHPLLGKLTSQVAHRFARELSGNKAVADQMASTATIYGYTVSRTAGQCDPSDQNHLDGNHASHCSSLDPPTNDQEKLDENSHTPVPSPAHSLSSPRAGSTRQDSVAPLSTPRVQVPPKPSQCKWCGAYFPTRNAMFRHLGTGCGKTKARMDYAKRSLTAEGIERETRSGTSVSELNAEQCSSSGRGKSAQREVESSQGQGKVESRAGIGFEDDALPPGWEQRWSKSRQREYFWCAETLEKTWDKPIAARHLTAVRCKLSFAHAPIKGSGDGPEKRNSISGDGRQGDGDGGTDGSGSGCSGCLPAKPWHSKLLLINRIQSNIDTVRDKLTRPAYASNTQQAILLEQLFHLERELAAAAPSASCGDAPNFQAPAPAPAHEVQQLIDSRTSCRGLSEERDRKAMQLEWRERVVWEQERALRQREEELFIRVRKAEEELKLRAREAEQRGEAMCEQQVLLTKTIEVKKEKIEEAMVCNIRLSTELQKQKDQLVSSRKRNSDLCCKLQSRAAEVAMAKSASNVQSRQIQVLGSKCEELEHSLECGICLERKRSYRFDPCGHLFCCHPDCPSAIVNVCPMCNLPVRKRQRTYI